MISTNAEITAEVELAPDSADLGKPSPVGSFGFILTFEQGSFSSAVMPSGSAHLIPGVPAVVCLKLLFPESAAPFLEIGETFTFFECGRTGRGHIVALPGA